MGNFPRENPEREGTSHRWCSACFTASPRFFYPLCHLVAVSMEEFALGTIRQNPQMLRSYHMSMINDELQIITLTYIMNLSDFVCQAFKTYLKTWLFIDGINRSFTICEWWYYLRFGILTNHFLTFGILTNHFYCTVDWDFPCQATPVTASVTASVIVEVVWWSSRVASCGGWRSRDAPFKRLKRVPRYPKP